MNKKFIETLAGKLKLDAEALAQTIASEEEATLELPEGDFYAKTDIETLKDNYGKERYEAGKVAEREVTYKNLSREVGLETIKDHSEFVKAYQDKILKDAKVEPEKKVAELSESVSKLQKQLEEKDGEIQNIQNSVKQKETDYKLASSFPDLPEGLGLTKAEAMSLFKMNMEVKEDGVYKNGQLLKDNLERPLSLEQAVSSYVTEKGWTKPEPPKGRGGGAGNQPAKPTITTIEEFESHLKEKGLTTGSAEANALLTEIAKENPEILN